jgi:hypothetical protein
MATVERALVRDLRIDVDVDGAHALGSAASSGDERDH